MQSRETQITMVKWTNAGGQTKRANERSFVYRPPAWRRWRNVKTTYIHIPSCILIRYRFTILHFLQLLKGHTHSWVEEQASKRAWSSSTFVIKAVVIKVNKRFLKQANSNKLFTSKAIARTIILSKSPGFYFEHIIDCTWDNQG